MNCLENMITTEKSHQYTELAISSFFNNTHLDKLDRFILIDNDNYIDYEITNIEILHHEHPHSFAQNLNKIINNADGSDLILLNNDIIFTPNWAEPLKTHNNKILIPACNQTHPYNCNKLNVSHTMTLEEFRNRYDELNQIAEFHTTTVNPKQVESLLMQFYAFVLPASVYQTVGYFDETFGKGGAEDVDYRFRTLLAGFEVKYTNESYLLHFHGKSTWTCETKEQIEERNNIYINRFKEKWGQTLTDIFIGRISNINDQNYLDIIKNNLLSI
jgi:GT2 family glycosyltransferase